MADIALLLSQARHWPARYRKRQVIYDEGDEASGIFRLTSGCVRLQVNGLEGHRQIVAFLFPGDVFGICMEARSSAAEAATDVNLTHYSLESVLQVSMQSQELIFELMRTANVQFNELAHHVEHVAHLPAHERVLWFFTWLSHRQGHPHAPVAIPMSRRDIGDFLALSPETLSRVIKSLQARGVLSPRGARAFAFRRPALQVRLERAYEEPTRIRGGTGSGVETGAF